MEGVERTKNTPCTDVSAAAAPTRRSGYWLVLDVHRLPERDAGPRAAELAHSSD